MREIKFRAWVGSEKRMERDMFYISQWDGLCHYTQPYHYEHEDKVIIYTCGEEEPILMQFTNLKDKNGKEIYEGDRINIAEGNLSGVYTVEFKYGCWGFDANRSGVEMDFIMIGYWVRSNNNTNILSQLEIVGNIYEKV